MRTIARILFMLIAASACQAFGEQRRSPVPEGYLVLRVYPGAEDFAYFAEKEGKAWVFPGKGREAAGPYDRADSGCWSPDGSVFAYTAVADGRSYAVAGGKILGSYDAKGIRAFAWPSGYSSPLYAAGEGVDSYIFAEGRREGPFAKVDLSYSRDFRELALCGTVAGKQGGSYLFAQGAKAGPLYYLQNMRWSEDGSAVAYSANISSAQAGSVFAGSRRFGLNAPAERLFFSPDGGSLAYITNPASGRELWANGKKMPGSGTAAHMPEWSPDGSVLGYVSQEGDSAYMMAGDRKLGPYKRVYSIAWSREGRLAYTAQEGDGWYLHDGDLKYGPFLDKAAQLEYSPDGSSLAAAIWDGKAMCLFVGDKKVGAYGEHINDLSWSPDGRTISFRQDGPGLALYVGGKAFSGFHNLYTYWWSEDGSTLEYSTVLIMKDGIDRNFTKVFRGGKMYTGGVSGNRVVYVDGASFVEEQGGPR